MTWTINLMYLILWTSLSGAIVSVVWFAIGRLLEKAYNVYTVKSSGSFLVCSDYVWRVVTSDYDTWRCVSFF